MSTDSTAPRTFLHPRDEIMRMMELIYRYRMSDAIIAELTAAFSTR